MTKKIMLQRHQILPFSPDFYGQTYLFFISKIIIKETRYDKEYILTNSF